MAHYSMLGRPAFPLLHLEAYETRSQAQEVIPLGKLERNVSSRGLLATEADSLTNGLEHGNLKGAVCPSARKGGVGRNSQSFVEAKGLLIGGPKRRIEGPMR